MAKQAEQIEIRLGRRDIGILHAICSSQMLSTSQLAAEFFSSAKKASARLKQLVDEGYLKTSRRTWTFVNTSTENFYSLDKKGIDALSASDDRPVARLTRTGGNIAHLAATNQFRVLLNRGIIVHPSVDAHFLSSWELSAYQPPDRGAQPGKGLGRNLVYSIKPDAVVTIGNDSGVTLLFFLEIDLDTEPVSRRVHDQRASLVGKIERYASYFDSREYQRDGQQLFGMSFRGFRMLLVTTSDSRIQRLGEIITGFGDTCFVWATTFSRLDQGGVLGQTWQVLASGDGGAFRSICDPYYSRQWPRNTEVVP